MRWQRRRHESIDERDADSTRFADGTVVSETEASGAGSRSQRNVRSNDGKAVSAKQRKTIIVTFDKLVTDVRKELTDTVTAVSYDGVKFARDAGIDCWHLAGSMCFQHVIHNYGTPEEKQRLRELKVGYWG